MKAKKSVPPREDAVVRTQKQTTKKRTVNHEGGDKKAKVDGEDSNDHLKPVTVAYINKLVANTNIDVEDVKLLNKLSARVTERGLAFVDATFNTRDAVLKNQKLVDALTRMGLTVEATEERYPVRIVARTMI